MGLEWTDDLSVGNALIDSDHMNLIGMVHSVEHALRSGNALILSQAFQRLVAGVGIHLVNEEKFALALALPFDEHWKVKQHQRHELEHIRDELEAKNGIWSEGAVEHFSFFLKNWMTEHIGRDEMALKPVLLAQPYHFKP